MEQLDIITNAEQFSALVKENISRKGIDELMNWLFNETDFKKAPCSTKYHMNIPGGLLQHSLNVYNVLVNLAVDFGYDVQKHAETLTIISLFHDVCKTNFYKPAILKKKVGSSWIEYQGYEIDDELPLGHGEKSCILIQRYMKLTNDELLAIRWHMGAYDDACRSGNFMQLSNAQNKHKFVTMLHCADMLASHIMEE